MHAFASAAGGGLDEHGEADVVRGSDEGLVAHRGVLRTGDERHTARGHRLLRGDLVTHRPDRVRPGAEEYDSGIGAGGGELGVLRQEPVAGVDGFGSRGLSSGDDLVDAQVGLGGGGRTQVDRCVRGLDVGRMGVGIGVDGDGADA